VEKDCIFCKIGAGETPAEFLYQDEQVVAVQDIAPQAPHHILIIPRKHIPTLLDLREGDALLLESVYSAAGKIASDRGFAQSGFRVVVNCNEDGGQTVWHLHFHLLGGRRLTWPPG
jgi:histidine triad (HIT) family protein